MSLEPEKLMQADEDYVRQSLTPYAGRLRMVVERGYQDWLASSDRAKFIFERSKANSRYDHIARYALIEFANDNAVHSIVGNGTIRLLFCKGTIVARFKHADEGGLGTSLGTQAELAFIDASQTIPGLLPDIHKVEICFRQNDFDTALESVAVTARDLDVKLWSYELPKSKGSAQVITLPTLLAPEDKPPLVRPRQTKKDSKEES